MRGLHTLAKRAVTVLENQLYRNTHLYLRICGKIVIVFNGVP